MSSGKRISSAAKRRAPQHRQGRGRHREPPRTVGDLVAVPGHAGAGLLAVGAIGSVAMMAMPAGIASAATGASPAMSPAASVQPASAPAPATAGTATTGPQVTAPVAYAPNPVVKVVIIGDSYTSGEGNNDSTYTTNANGQVMPQHQSNMSPTMQALQQIINANPGIDFQVTNVAVSGATRSDAYSPSQPGTPNVQPSQLSAVQNADIVINGFGGNDAGFPAWARTLMSPATSDASVPALWTGDPSNPSAPNYSQFFTSGLNLSSQVNIINDIAQNAKPGAVIITNGYPQVFGDTAPSWSPFSPYTTTLGQNAATYSNLFAQNLSSDNQSAAQIAEVKNYPAYGTTSYFGNLQGALNGGVIGSPNPMVNYINTTIWPPGVDQSSFHPNPLGQTAEGSALLPIVGQAVQDVGNRNGFQVNTNVQPVMDTFAYEWNNRVDVPLQVQSNQQYQQGQLMQQAQQGPQFNADGTPANLWTALTARYPQPSADQNAGWPPVQGTPTAFPAQQLPGQPAASPVQPPSPENQQNQVAPPADAVQPPVVVPAPDAVQPPVVVSAPDAVQPPAVVPVPDAVQPPAATDTTDASDPAANPPAQLVASIDPSASPAYSGPSSSGSG